MSKSIQILVAGPLIRRHSQISIPNLAITLNQLARILSEINPNNGVHIQTYEHDSKEIIEFLELNDSLSISTTSDPGPDVGFVSKKGVANTSRMFRIGTSGLKNINSEICCKTRVELLPDFSEIRKFVTQIERTSVALKKMGDDAIAILMEDYSGPLAYKKGTLCAMADTFHIANTAFLHKLYSRAEEIWLDYKNTPDNWSYFTYRKTPQILRETYPMNEQYLGCAFYEYSSQCDTSFLKKRLDFQFRSLLAGRSLEKNKILFLSFSSFGFMHSRFYDASSGSLVSKQILIVNRIPVLRRLIDLLFIAYRLKQSFFHVKNVKYTRIPPNSLSIDNF